MEDQVSLVRYFADVSKLVTICYKLSLEKQDLLKKANFDQESQSQSQQKIPISLQLSEQLHNKSKVNNKQYLEENLNQKQKKQKKILSKTRSGKQFFKSEIKNDSNKMQQENQIYCCQDCDKKYYHMKSLKRHIKCNHQVIKLTNQIQE